MKIEKFSQFSTKSWYEITTKHIRVFVGPVNRHVFDMWFEPNNNQIDFWFVTIQWGRKPYWG